jgi:hypothetical protein
MNFFCTKKHYDEWLEASGQSEDRLFILPVAEAIVVAEWLFGLQE